MKEKRIKKRLSVFIAILLIISVPIGAYAIKKGLEPVLQSGGYYSLTENRMDFQLDKTEFTFNFSDDESTYILSAELSVRKCEADFYAIINSIDLTGLDCNYISFTADASNTVSYVPENLILRDNEVQKWKIEISFDTSEKATFTPELQIDYTSGITSDTADSHLLSIPLTITIN